MHAAHIEDDKLQLFFDGELATGEARLIDRHVSSCADCGARLRSFERLRALIGLAAGDAESSVDSEALLGRVFAGIVEQQRAGRAPRLRALVGGGGSEGGRARRWIPAVAAAVALAAAAVIALVATTGDERAGEVARQRRRRSPVALAALAASAPRGSHVIEVDFRQNAGTVFEVEDVSGVSLAVVWISEPPLPGDQEEDQ